MAVLTEITNPEQFTYYVAEEARRIVEAGYTVTEEARRVLEIGYESAEEARRLLEETYRLARDVSTLAEMGTQITQLGAYYSAADSAINSRDTKINAQKAFMVTLEDFKLNQDLPMVQLKKSVLTDLVLPVVDRCFVATQLTEMSVEDGEAVDLKSEQLLAETNNGLPDGWSMHEGMLMGARAGSYNGGILANSEKRRLEGFRSSKTGLVKAAHSSNKSVYNAGDTLSKYAQAASIHSGLADLYIQGFNSAGAALGVTLGKLSDGNNNVVGDIANVTGVSTTAGTDNNVGNRV